MSPEPSRAASGLIAAAHAVSFCLALTRALRLKTFTEGQIVVTAAPSLVRGPTGWSITNIHLNVVSRLPGVTQGRFIDAAVRAKTRCVVSRSLRATVSMNAKLES